MKKIFKITSVLLLSLILISCGSSGAKDDKSTLKLAVNDAATTMNFLYTILEPNINIITNLQEGLVQYDSQTKIIPATAKSWDISADNLTYTFHLRDNLTWSNGTKLTANDFVYAIETRINDKEAVYAHHYRHLLNGEAVIAKTKNFAELGVKAIDDTTVQFTLAEPKAFFLDLLTFEIFLPLNKQFYEATGPKNYGTSDATIIANGAYKLSAFNGASGWTLAKNDNYWDAAKVAINTIDVKVVKEASTREIMWKNGELDIVDLTADQIDGYKDSKNLYTTLNPKMNYFYLSNTTKTPNPLLGNKNFRAAIAHSIDKQVITSSVLKDGSVPADYFVAQNTIFNEGQDFRDLSPNFKTPLFNVAKAKDFLALAKSEMGQTNFEFDLENYDLGITPKIYENIKAQIEQNLPEVKVNLIANPTQTYFQKLYQHGTPAAASQWEPDFIDVESFFRLFVSTSNQNFSRWNSSAFDMLYNQAESAALASNRSERFNLYVKAEKVLTDDYTIIPVYQSGVTYLMKDTISGYSVSPALPHIAYKFIHKS
ncbi:MAG: peptide ABC transporter substrate-binding protein [Culicoidibacterales bacterium]